MREQKLGPLPSWEYDKSSCWDAGCMNPALYGLENLQPTPECLEFIISQYRRFNVPFPAEIRAVAETASIAAFSTFENMDPYLFLGGMTDVVATDDWSLNTYELVDGGYSFELDPENVETFSFLPGEDEVIFDDVMSHPGLDRLPMYSGELIREVLNGDAFGHDFTNDLCPASRDILKTMCGWPTAFNREMFDAYFELSAWAATAWLIGPLGREFRASRNTVCEVAVNHGEALVVDGDVIRPGSYRKHPRPPKSCISCGLSAWCVEMVSTGFGTNYLCERCATDGMPPSPISTCGTKRCLLAQCKHHPYFGLGGQGIHHARRDFGQLAPKRNNGILALGQGRI